MRRSKSNFDDVVAVVVVAAVEQLMMVAAVAENVVLASFAHLDCPHSNRQVGERMCSLNKSSFGRLYHHYHRAYRHFVFSCSF